jgi:hypothetical protein
MANIVYERLSNSIATVKAALNWLIPKISDSNTVGNWKFITTNGSGTIEGLSTWSANNPLPPGTASPGSNTGNGDVSRWDHVHPNTCPPPIDKTHIVNKAYVDSRITPVGELGVIAGYEHTQALTLNTVHKLTYLNSIVSESVTHPLDGSVYVLQKISEAGRYAVSFYGLYSCTVNNPVIKATVYKGSTDSITEETHIGSGGKLGLANDLRTGGSHGVLTLNANDYVGIKIISDASTTITHKKMSFSVVKI